MTIPYVNVQQVKYAMRSTYNGADDQLITAQIIPAACSWLDKYCNRANGGFAVQTYDELYNGTGTTEIFLNNIPVQQIFRVSSTELPAVSITNNDSDMGTRALVQVIGTPSNPDNLNSQYTSTGITLTYIKSAVTTTNTLLWTSYPTVGALVAAINGLGNHWSATVQGGFQTWASTDLRATQGAFGARITTCYLWIHWWDIPWFRVVNENTGEINSEMGFCRGVANWRITYSAGYTALPEDLTQALAELCVGMYYAREMNSNAQSETLGPYSYSQMAKNTFDGLSMVSKKTINLYKIRKVNKFSTW